MVCMNCGKTFDGAKVIKTTEEAYYGVGGTFGSRTPLTIEVCPYCDSEDVGEEDDTEDDVESQ